MSLRRNGRTAVETLYCQNSSDGTVGPSDRSTPTPETGALPPDCNGHGIPNNTYRTNGQPLKQNHENDLD